MKVLVVILIIVCMVFSASGCSPAATVAGNASLQPSASAVATTAAPASPSPAPAATSPAITDAVSAEPSDTETKDYEQIGSDLMASESIGEVKLNMTESELLAACGQPDSESDPELWGADGLKHSDWTYKAKGLVVNMAESANPESEFVVYSVIVSAPCDQATQKGIKIGDAKAAVLETYGYAVQDQSDDATTDSITAGSPFGGIIFEMKDGKVSAIFLGASAE